VKVQGRTPRTRTRIETRTKETTAPARRTAIGWESRATDEWVRWAPKDSELCLCWRKHAEMRVDGLSRSDVQLDGRTWA